MAWVLVELLAAIACGSACRSRRAAEPPLNLLLITLGTISDFTLIFAMTQGGPGNQTAILPVYMYIEAFQFNQLGYGTAIALTLVLIGAILSIAYIRQLRPELKDAKS